MNMLAMIVITACMLRLPLCIFSRRPWSSFFPLSYGDIFLKLMTNIRDGSICRYPSKDEQFHFFRHYLNSNQSNEVNEENFQNFLYFNCACCIARMELV